MPSKPPKTGHPPSTSAGNAQFITLLKGFQDEVRDKLDILESMFVGLRQDFVGTEPNTQDAEELMIKRNKVAQAKRELRNLIDGAQKIIDGGKSVSEEEFSKLYVDLRAKLSEAQSGYQEEAQRDIDEMRASGGATFDVAGEVYPGSLETHDGGYFGDPVAVTTQPDRDVTNLSDKDLRGKLDALNTLLSVLEKIEAPGNEEELKSSRAKLDEINSEITRREEIKKAQARSGPASSKGRRRGTRKLPAAPGDEDKSAGSRPGTPGFATSRPGTPGPRTSGFATPRPGTPGFATPGPGTPGFVTPRSRTFAPGTPGGGFSSSTPGSSVAASSATPLGRVPRSRSQGRRKRALPEILRELRYHDSAFLIASPVIFLNAKLPDLFDSCEESRDYDELSIEMIKFCIENGIEVAKLKGYKEESSAFVGRGRSADLVIPFAFFDKSHRLTHSYLVFERSGNFPKRVGIKINIFTILKSGKAEAIVPEKVYNFLKGVGEDSRVLNPDILIQKLGEGFVFNDRQGRDIKIELGRESQSPDFANHETHLPKVASLAGGVSDSSPSGGRLSSVLKAGITGGGETFSPGQQVSGSPLAMQGSASAGRRLGTEPSSQHPSGLSLVRSEGVTPPADRELEIAVNTAVHAKRFLMTRLPVFFQKLKLDFFCSERAFRTDSLSILVNSQDKQRPLFSDDEGNLKPHARLMIEKRKRIMGEEADSEDFFSSVKSRFGAYPQELEEELALEIAEGSKLTLVDLLWQFKIRSSGDLHNMVLLEGDKEKFDVSNEGHLLNIIKFLELRLVRNMQEIFRQELILKTTDRKFKQGESQIKAAFLKRLLEDLEKCCTLGPENATDEMDFVRNAIINPSGVGVIKMVGSGGRTAGWKFDVASGVDHKSYCCLGIGEMEIVDGSDLQSLLSEEGGDKKFIEKLCYIFDSKLKKNGVIRDFNSAIFDIAILRSMPMDVVETLCSSSWRIAAMADVCVSDIENYREKWMAYVEGLRSKCVEYYRENEEGFRRTIEDAADTYSLLDMGMVIDESSFGNFSGFRNKLIEILKEHEDPETRKGKITLLMRGFFVHHDLISQGFSADAFEIDGSKAVDKGEAGNVIAQYFDTMDIEAGEFDEVGMRKFYSIVDSASREGGVKQSELERVIENAFRTVFAARSLPQTPRLGSVGGATPVRAPASTDRRGRSPATRSLPKPPPRERSRADSLRGRAGGESPLASTTAKRLERGVATAGADSLQDGRLTLRGVQANARIMSNEVLSDLFFDRNASKWQGFLGNEKSGEELQKSQLAAIELTYMYGGIVDDEFIGSESANQRICWEKITGIHFGMTKIDRSDADRDQRLSYIDLITKAAVEYQKFAIANNDEKRSDYSKRLIRMMGIAKKDVEERVSPEAASQDSISGDVKNRTSSLATRKLLLSEQVYKLYSLQGKDVKSPAAGTEATASVVDHVSGDGGRRPSTSPESSGRVSAASVKSSFSKSPF